MAGAGIVLVLSGVSLLAPHTRTFRSFVLLQVQVLARESQEIAGGCDERTRGRGAEAL